MLESRPLAERRALRDRGCRRLLVALGLALLLPVLGVGTASAVPFEGAGLKQVSGTSPFASCTADNVAGQPGTNFPNSEVEPWVDVNPTNPANIVGIWQQDRWSNGGARGLVAGVSRNGGKSWTKVVIPGISLCSGGDLERASDPWVSFAPNGDAYAISLLASADLLTSAIAVNKSTDGGLTWGSPTELIRDTSAFQFNDKESITADPTDANFVYAVWDRSNFPGEQASIEALHAFAFRSDIMFSRTTNGGASWESARAIFEPRANLFSVGNQIAVLPDGTLVDVFELVRGAGVAVPQFFEALIRSTDQGVTWSSRPIIASDHFVIVVRDPDTGQRVRTGDIIPDVAVDSASGTLYLVWQDGRFSGGAHSDIAFSTSTDGGLTWTAPVKVNQTPTTIPAGNQQAFTASVHVAADGTVGVTYYDFRNNTPAPGLPTDYWLVHCHIGCTDPGNWSETHVAGPFDMEKAPVARGFFVGDYEGLAAVGNVFTPFFVQTTATDTGNVYFAKVGP